MAELTYEGVLELFAETSRKMAESDKKIDKINRELSKKLSEFGDTLGRFAEEQVRADILNRFDNWGIPVHSITNHFEQRDMQNNFAYEIDILIYNSKYVVAIEVKNTLKKDDVDLHLEKMKKIQAIPFPDSKGKILLAGVAGMIVGNGVDQYAESNGLFVLKPSGETIKIANNKKTFKPREWEVK